MADFTDDILLSSGNTVALTGGLPPEDIVSSNGSQTDVVGVKEDFPNDDISISEGDQVTVDGVGEFHGEVLSSNGSRVLDTPIQVSAGAQVQLAGERPLTQIVLSADTPYLTGGNNEYEMYVIYGQDNIHVNYSSISGEPDYTPTVVIQSNDDNAVDQPVTDPSVKDFYFNALDTTGTAVYRISAGVPAVHAHLTIHVVEEYPDKQLVKNGSQVTFDYSMQIINPNLLNNNYNNVNIDGTVIFTGDVAVDNGNSVVVAQTHNLAVSNSGKIELVGGMSQRQDISIKQAGTVTVVGQVTFGGDAITSAGSNTESVTGHIVGVAAGGNSEVLGWKEEPNTVVVVNGSAVEIVAGGIIIYAPNISVSNGGQVHFTGQKPEDINVSHPTVVSVFRGIQKESSDINVSSGINLVLTGTANGGTVSDVAIPCLTFYSSMVAGRCFVKGQIEEIPEISLDSSIKLGVKLYSCDNTLFNPTSFTSAYFTFDDSLQLPANIDPVNSLTYVIATPTDLAVLTRNKVYDVRLHAVDKSGNPSIVLTRKLRFI